MKKEFDTLVSLTNEIQKELKLKNIFNINKLNYERKNSKHNA